MASAHPMVEIWRGDLLESQHRGHAVVCSSSGDVVESWGDPDQVILPRSSCKMIQALPLIESGAADAANLSTEQLALACASHNGAAIHTERVSAWLATLGLGETDLRCGPQWPDDRPASNGLVKSDTSPCQIHNNCSGKHTGFLTLAQHLRAGPEYIEIDHPVQKMALEAFERMTGETSPTWAIDGCSAPNFAVSITGLARAMALFARASEISAAGRLRDAMRAYPELVAGEGRACTELMRAMDHKVTIKTGAEAVYTAILPEQGLGIVVKIEDGTTRGAEAAITALLTKYGVLDGAHPAALKRLGGAMRNRRGLEVGTTKAAPGFA